MKLLSEAGNIGHKVPVGKLPEYKILSEIFVYLSPEDWNRKEIVNNMFVSTSKREYLTLGN